MIKFEILILSCSILIIPNINNELIDESIGNDQYDLGLYDFDQGKGTNTKANYITTLPPDSVCGKTLAVNSVRIVQEIDNLTRIAGGRVAKGLTWPSMCALFSNSNNSFRYICGASIINNRWLVTAASCVTNIANVAVLCGRQDIGRWLNNSTLTLGYRKTKDIVVNPNWDKSTGNNDIALIKVLTNIKFSKYEQPICLTNTTFITNATTVWIAGWGSINNKSVQLSKKLRENQIGLVSNAICAAQLNIYSPQIVNKCKLCAGGPGNGTCYGDNGGPVVVKDMTVQMSTLHGIISNPSCATDYPGVYMRVACVLDWIKSILQSH